MLTLCVFMKRHDLGGYISDGGEPQSSTPHSLTDHEGKGQFKMFLLKDFDCENIWGMLSHTISHITCVSMLE